MVHSVCAGAGERDGERGLVSEADGRERGGRAAELSTGSDPLGAGGVRRQAETLGRAQ